jgi:hypothetical protein
MNGAPGIMIGMQPGVRLALISRTSSAALSLLVLLGISTALGAQGAKTPTLEEILSRLETNLNHYDSGIPSFFCEEHLISQVDPGQRSQNTVTDSVFRLKRVLDADHTATLEESREVKKVDGKPATAQGIDGPAMLSGVFEGAPAVVSLNQTACTNYSLERINGKRPGEPYVVRFATVLTPENQADCLLQENSKGRAFIDPASMQITRLEVTTPHHTIIPGGGTTSRIVGERVLAVDYASVHLGGETFWLPTLIDSRSTSGAGTFHKMVWSFRASYRNYHKLEVTSRIVPDREAPVR